MARPDSPEDTELRELYEQVWAGFAAEPTENDLDTIYSGYDDREIDTPTTAAAATTATTATTPATDYSHSEPTTTTATYSPQTPVGLPTNPRSNGSVRGRGVRKLPPTPGGGQPPTPSSSSSSSSPASFSMPEPRPFYHNDAPANPPYYHDNATAAPAPNVLLKKAVSSGRRLPVVPGSPNQRNGYDNSGIGSPVSPNRPAMDSYQDSYHRDISSPPSSASLMDLPPEVPPYSPPEQSSPPVQDQKILMGNAPYTGYQDTLAAGSSSTNVDRNGSGGSSSFIGGSFHNAGPSNHEPYTNGTANPPPLQRGPTELLQSIATFRKGPLELHDEIEHSTNNVNNYNDEDDEYWEDGDDMSDNSSFASRFVNFSLLSHIAVQLRDKVPRGTHVKGSIPYPRAFTGKDIVQTIQSQIQRELLVNQGVSTNDRRAALQVARSLQSQLFFYEVEWGGRMLVDGVEDVYMFLDDQEGPSGSGGADGGGGHNHLEREELPTGVITMLTKCYSPSCGEGTCYSFACPRKGPSAQTPLTVETPEEPLKLEWGAIVPREVLVTLPESEINRQTIIHKVISKEEQYISDLDIVESCFIKPLREANPPVMPAYKVEEFIEEVFGNILDLRECNRRLLENMYVRQREQAPVIQRIGDVFLTAATEFRFAYPIYLGHLPLAEKRMKEETDVNLEFRLFLEKCYRSLASPTNTLRLDLKHFLNRPSEHLQKYPVLLEAIFHETAEGNPDADYLQEAIEAIQNLQTVAQLRSFQSAMGKGVTGKWEWHDLVSPEIRAGLMKEECKRQSIIFELIKGEMAYVKDLENIDFMYIRPLRAADPPIIPRERLDSFINDVYHNFGELHAHHLRLVEVFHTIQREQHPIIRSVTAAVFDSALNFRDAYMEYIPNYPIASYRIDHEMEVNGAFKAFVENAIRHPDAHRLDMKSFINRPIPRLLRYELLLKGILDETPVDHEDRIEIPQVLDVIKALGKETEPGVVSAKQKVELWRYNSNLIFKAGEHLDMDLLNEHRSLIFTGKLLRQPDSGLEWNGWSELFVLLFDNYMVMTKPKDKDGVTKYHVNRRPIPLDLLTLVNFNDPPTQRGRGILRGAGGVVTSPESTTDSRSVYPCTLHHNGRLGGPYILYAESAQARTDWHQKLEEALGLRKVVQESNKVFEVETLSVDTFLVPSLGSAGTSGNTPSWNNENSFTGRVTCSVPFNTPDGRGLVAIGCAEGVWIGFRHDSRSMRRVLHLKMVTQCAMLEDFGIFLVLADKSLFAYHIEALVPSSPQSSGASQTPEKLNGTKDVHFFSVGQLHGRTLVIYMKKKGLESVFRVLEPVVERINERTRTPAGLGSRLGFRAARSAWFRVYRDFFLPSESFDLIFLKAKIAILCTKGFEIMDLTDFKSVTLPQRDDPRLEKLAKRCEASKPMGMFRSREDEFLLCFDEFGVYVDKHGDPRSANTIEWEGTAERVAFHPPYVLLFDTRFIEIRHVETGRLAQIIPGNDMHCLWDGRGSSAAAHNPAQTPASFDEHVVQEARVHGVMNAEGQQRGGKAIAQHVFELIPTIPLYLPGSLASPSTSTYFPLQNTSPPHSPTGMPIASGSGGSGQWR